MRRYVLKRLFQAIFVLLAVLSLVFIIGRQIGDPARLILGLEAPEADVVALREEMGLNDPIFVQYGRFLVRAVQGDFGTSYWQGVPTIELVLERIPATLFLSALAFGSAVPLAILIGVLAAVRPGSFMDRLTTVLSLAGVCIVDFWLALMLIIFVSVRLGWLPTSGFVGVGLAGLPFAILPVATLILGPVGRVAQLTRIAMIEEINQAYVKTARAKGLSEYLVLGKHALKNALIPTITLSGDVLISLMNGVIIVEFIFAWPGVGQLLMQAIQRRDLPTIETLVFTTTVMVVCVNLVVDMTYAYINPRIRYDSA
ncbi:MAG: ABC transporter permease [Proteobacteria bacterium]|nr:ABC transporter permease [Pseudomonadota bacterium]